MFCVIKNPKNGEYIIRSDNNIFEGRQAYGRPKKVVDRKPKKPEIVFSSSPMLAGNYKDTKGVPKINPVGWYMSEKFDGYRAIWNGRSFKSRNNNHFSVPRWFREFLPNGIALDGELWLGRENFESCGLFRKKMPKKKAQRELWEKAWLESGVIYKVYDLPNSDLPFEQRMTKLKNIIYKQLFSKVNLDLFNGGNIKNYPIQFTEQILIDSAQQLENKFLDIVGNGGEGLILREPGNYYENKRSESMLKYKMQADMECKIIGYRKSSVNNIMLGAFRCQLLGNKLVEFTVGGLNSDVKKTYKKTHKIGSIITVQHNGFTKTGKPRHVRYLRKRVIF